MSATIEQFDLVPQFDLLDLIRDRGLADAQAAGSCAKAAVERDGEERASLAWSHSFNL